MSDDQKSNDDKPEANKGIDYILAGLVFLIAAIRHGISDNEPPNNQAAGATYEIAKWTKVVGSWTRGLVFVGLLTVAVLALQLCVLRQTDETMRAGQRAFIFVKQSPGQWIEPTKISDIVVHRWHIEWENSGNSQTKDLTLELYCSRPSAASIHDPITAYGKPTVSSQRLLGPKQSQWGGICGYKASELKQVEDGWHLYVGARATYEDIFGASHTTEYCTEIIDLTGPFDKLDVRPDNRLRPCETRNCADKECDKAN